MSVIVHEQIHQIKKTVIQRQKSSWNPTSSVLVALGSFNAYRVQHHKCCSSCSFFLRESSEHVHDRCRNSTCQHIHEPRRQSALVSPRVVRIAACSTAGLPGVWVIHTKFIADKSKFFLWLSALSCTENKRFRPGISKNLGHFWHYWPSRQSWKIHWTSNNSSLVASVIIPPQNPKPFLMTIEKLGHIFQDYEILKHSSIDHHHWYNQQNHRPHLMWCK